MLGDEISGSTGGDDPRSTGSFELPKKSRSSRKVPGTEAIKDGANGFDRFPKGFSFKQAEQFEKALDGGITFSRCGCLLNSHE